MQPLQRLDDVAAIAMDVGDRRILPDPDAAVDAVAQFLGELAVDFRRDPDAGRVRVDDGAGVDRCLSRIRAEQTKNETGNNEFG